MVDHDLIARLERAHAMFLGAFSGALPQLAGDRAVFVQFAIEDAIRAVGGRMNNIYQATSEEPMTNLEFSTGSIVGRRVYWTDDAGEQSGIVVAVATSPDSSVERLSFVLLIAVGDTLVQRNATSVKLG